MPACGLPALLLPQSTKYMGPHTGFPVEQVPCYPSKLPHHVPIIQLAPAISDRNI